MAAPPTAKRMPTSASSRPDLAEGVLGGQRGRSEELRSDALRQKDTRRDDHQREGEEAAERRSR